MYYTETLSAQGYSRTVSLQPGETMYYTSSGTFTGYLKLFRSRTQGSTFEAIVSPAVDTNVTAGYIKNETNAEERYRFGLFDTDAETPVTGSAVVLTQAETGKAVISTSRGKIGATSGWVVAAADDTSLNTCPASKTGSTLILPLLVETGMRITGFHLLGQIESAGNTVTVDAVLKRVRAAAADVVTATIASMVQMSVTADTKIDNTNSYTDAPNEVVTGDDTYFIIVTVTTGASTDIVIQGAHLNVVPQKPGI